MTGRSVKQTIRQTDGRREAGDRLQSCVTRVRHGRADTSTQISRSANTQRDHDGVRHK